MGNIKFLLLVFSLIAIVANGYWEEERSALLDLQANIMRSNGELLVDWAGYNANGFIDCCFWESVKCSLETGRVIKLNLGSERFGSGDIWRFNASLFLPFKSLQVLLLSNRNITGWTKNEGFSKLRQLPNLKEVDLQYNPIHPKVLLSSLCSISSLEVLKLGVDVGTSFSIPTTYNTSISKKCGGLTNLRELWFEGYGINDINILFALGVGANTGLRNLERLNLNYNDFNSTIFSSLKIFPSLKQLELAANKINGNIKMNDIIALSNLKYLDLWNNNIKSFVTTKGWCELKHIEELDFLNNNFEGTLPSCLGNFTSLRWLSLAGNNLRDTEFQNWIPNFQLEFFAIQRCINLQKLPSFLHYQYDLRILAIGRNQLAGNFPTWLLENNTRLVGIYGRDNAFSGPFKLPSSRHLHLETIDVSNNKLNGHIPENMSLAFPKLTSLNMSQNFLEGPIPSKICGIHLNILDLSINLLSGEVPSDLAVGPLPKNTSPRSLIVLDVSKNNFTWEIPRWITDNTRLLQLDLSKNHLDGSIPDEICNLKLIQVLAISENRLSGFIPSCMSSLPVEHIHLEKNQLGGELGHVLFNFSSLITLDLGNNNLTGNIPHTIGSLNTLNYLLLSNNQLEGEIPTQICMLKKLSIVDLSFNKLDGPLLPCLSYLTLAKKDAQISKTNYATSSRRSWLTFLAWIRLKRHFHDSQGIRSNMFLMDVETQVQFSTKRNSYTYKGSILKYMSGIDLSSNRLIGEIPVELGNMSNIHALNLSHNHLIGRIPNTFSNLQEIESLDLSGNRLNGSISVGLLELNYLAVFGVAYNNLSGAVPDFKAQFETFNKSSYEGNPFLCGYPLDNKCGMSPKLSNTSKINGDEESSELEDIECFFIGFVASYGAILLGLAAALCFNRYWRKAWFMMIDALMFCCYYFVLDNIVTPIKSRWCRNVG
ncbi:hypothetical protein KY284_032443 [Solanum tuberosum]|nr:hypothetical protein KY284_032443 [Solanum tuberosum]